MVTSADKRHACVAWFEQLPKRMNVKVSFQTGSLADDFCALVRAKNMVVSFSTLSTRALLMGASRVKEALLEGIPARKALRNAAAILSKQLRRVYVRQFAANSMLNCQLWPEVSLIQYTTLGVNGSWLKLLRMPITEQHHEPYNNTYGGVIEWFQTYNVSEITRRTSCK